LLLNLYIECFNVKVIDITLSPLSYSVLDCAAHRPSSYSVCIQECKYVHAVCRLDRDLRLGSPEIDSTWPIRRKCSRQEPASSTIYGPGKVIRSRSCEFDSRAGSRNTTWLTTSLRRIAAIVPTYPESGFRLRQSDVASCRCFATSMWSLLQIASGGIR